MITAFYVLNFLCLFGVDTTEAKRLTTDKYYAKSTEVLKYVRPTAENYKEYCFLQAANYFALNDKENCEKWLAKYSDSFNSSTRRYDVLTAIMEEDITKWKNGDLFDIERDMRNSVTRLETSSGGKETQRIQQQIVDKLNKLIEEEENKNKQSGNADANSPLPTPESQPQPQQDSVIQGGSGAGVTAEKLLKQYAGKWGDLPPEKREAVIKEIEMSIPKKYAPFVEEYMRAANRYRK
jgi:hypothetical protein